MLRVHEDLDEGVRVVLRHLLDLHAPLGAAHDDDRFGATVNGGAQVVFLLDVGGVGHQHALDYLAPGVLLVLEEPAQDIFGVAAGGLYVLRVLDAPGFAAPAHHHLRLDHHRLADAPGNPFGLIRRIGHVALVDGHARAGKQFLRLVFVEFHSNLQSSV